MMLKKTILTFSLVAGVFARSAQDQMALNKEKGRYEFTVTGKDADRMDSKKPLRSAVEILSDYPKAADFAKKAKSNYDAGVTLSLIGGGLVGWELGRLIGGAEMNAAVIGVGADVLLTTIPLASGFKKNINQAIAIYNGNENTQSILLDMGLQNHGLGISLTFR